MSEERKAKAAARKAARKQKNVEPIERKPLVAPAAEIDVMSTIKKPQEIDASSLRLQDVSPITPAKVIPTGVGGVAQKTGEEPMPTQLPSTAKLEVKLPQGAQQVNPTNTLDIKPKVITISDMLEGQRRKAIQDKTDAAKMQKYYALTDALNAIGKMGATAVGGKIGGNTLDSAMIVPEYKPSRGYLDAFEKAKQANDRLRALDEKEFQLKYNDAQRAADRAYKAEQDRIAREWQAEQKRLDREWQEAVADKNFERQAELKERMLELENNYKKEIIALNQKHEKEIKQMSYDIVKMQTGNSGKGSKTVPLRLKNGKGLQIPKEYYDDMLNSFIGMENGQVDEDNVKEFARNHPELVNEYLTSFGMGFMEPASQQPIEQAPAEEPVVEQKPKKSFWSKLGESIVRAGDVQVPSYNPALSQLNENDYTAFKRAK